jgi:death-on-curing protein
MSAVRLLEPEDLEGIATRLGLVVRDGGLLASAAMRPATRLYGEEMYPGVVTKAAAVMHSVVTNHPLVDGNKRLGWLVLVITLDLNGVRLDVDDDEGFDLTMRVAEGATDLEEIVDVVQGWIERNADAAR